MNNKQYDKLRAAFEATQPQLPPDFTDRVMREIDAQPATNRRWRWMAAAACLLFAIGLGGTLWSTSPTEKPMLAETTQENTVVPSPATHQKEQTPSAPEEAVKEEDTPQSIPSPAELKQRRTPVATLAHEPKELKAAPADADRTNDLTAHEPEMNPAANERVKPEPAENLIAATDNAAKTTAQAASANTRPQTLTERDIPITRPENYKHTPEEIALLKRQADEAYLKWVELELEIAKYNLEQTAQQ